MAKSTLTFYSSSFQFATVFQDKNNNGNLDAGEPSGLTGADGKVGLFVNPKGGNIVLQGGMDLISGTENTYLDPTTKTLEPIRYTAPVTSPSLSTLTTIWSEWKSTTGKSEKETDALVSQKLDLSGFKLRNFDEVTTFNKNAASPQTQTQQRSETQIDVLKEAIKGIGGFRNLEGKAAVEFNDALLKSLAQAILDQPGTVDFTSKDTVQQIVTDALDILGKTYQITLPTAAQLAIVSDLTSQLNGNAQSIDYNDLANVYDIAESIGALIVTNDYDMLAYAAAGDNLGAWLEDPGSSTPPGFDGGNGDSNVNVAPAPAVVSEMTKVSGDAGGTDPTVSGNGRTVTYVSGDGKIISKDVASGEEKPAPETTEVATNSRYKILLTDKGVVVGDDNHRTDVYLEDTFTVQTTPAITPQQGQGSFSGVLAAKANLTAVTVLDHGTPDSAQANNSTDVVVTSPGNSHPLFDTNGNNSSFSPAFTADGKYMVFASYADNLLGQGKDNNNASDIFVRDMETGKIALVSMSGTGQQGNGDSFAPQISSEDGAYITFASQASNLVEGDSNGKVDVFMAPNPFYFGNITEPAGHDEKAFRFDGVIPGDGLQGAQDLAIGKYYNLADQASIPQDVTVNGFDRGDQLTIIGATADDLKNLTVTSTYDKEKDITTVELTYPGTGRITDDKGTSDTKDDVVLDTNHFTTTLKGEVTIDSINAFNAAFRDTARGVGGLVADGVVLTGGEMDSLVKDLSYLWF